VKRAMVVLMLFAVGGVLSPEPAEANQYSCVWQITDVATVTAGGASTTTYYYTWSCDVTGGGGGGTQPPAPNPTNPPNRPTVNDVPNSPDRTDTTTQDSDNDGKVDRFSAVVGTKDPQSACLLKSDRLGTSFGGPNTARPSHSGVDLQCDWGDPVRAFEGGSVSWMQSTDVGDCGIGIEITSASGSKARYCHLSGLAVNSSGVTQGARIGFCGSTGNSTGDHLHLTYDHGTWGRMEYFEFSDIGPTLFELNGCNGAAMVQP
jgi:hypothetical protein